VKSISEPFVQRPVLTVLMTVSAVLFGVLAYLNLPVNDLPAVDYPVIQVRVAYPGASPDTVAANIATPLEKQFMQISGLDLVTSNSTQGNCSMVLQFNLNKSIDAAATDVQTAISQAAGNLPVDLPSPPTFSKTNPNDQPILYVGLTSDTVTSGRLYDFASTNVGQRLSILPGVSRVDTYGTKSAVRIKADPSALAARGISLDDLTNAIRQGTSYQGAGQFDGPSRSFLLRPQGQLETAEQYNNLIIDTRDGSPIYLKDVARAVDSVQDERIDMRFWIRGRTVPKATVVVAVFRQAGTNAVEVAQSVKDLLPQIERELPSSIQIVPIYDRSKTIVNSVQDVKETLYIAFFLVVLVIFIFLGRASDTLIPAVALPLSMLLTFIVMNLLGYSLDNLSLMALTLAIGFLVDDAIVFLENTVRRMEHGEKALEATLNSSREISFTILAMTISLASVFLPLVFMPGLVGRIFREFSITIIVSIFASGLVSLTLTPMMCSRMLGARGKGAHKTLMERAFDAIEHPVLALYGRSLWFFIHHKWISVLVWIVCLGGTVYYFMALPKSFLPIGDSSFVRGVMIAQEGSSPEQMRRYQGRVESRPQKDENVDMTFTMTGNSGIVSSSQGFVLAFLKDPEKRIGQLPIGAVAGELMGSLRGVPGVIVAMFPSPVLQISVGASASAAGKYQYTISGVNAPEVYAAAERMMPKFQQYSGFASVVADYYSKTPALAIKIDRDQAAAYNVSSSRILELLKNAYSQNYVYLIKKPTDQYQVILEARDDNRAGPDNLDLLYIRSDDGQRLVPLKGMVSWEPVLGMQSVNHLNQFTSVTFSFNLKPDVAVGPATNFIEQTFREVAPASLRGQLQGEAQTFRETITSLIPLAILAIFVMYIILGVLYESYLHPITVLSSLPVALVGGFATLHYLHQEASLYAYVGAFMLMGIVKKNGIMVVDFALQRIRHGQTAQVAIHEASVDRFRPIIMTSLAAIMGALPIALGWGADGASRRPLGLIIVGGLVFAQFITLYITPAIYLYLELFQEKVLDRTSFFHSSRHVHGGEGPQIEPEEAVPALVSGNGQPAGAAARHSAAHP
jgi:HAE1 family hydrophobic/amphiphilic exporter-1